MFWVTLTLVTLVIVWLSGLLLWRIWPRSAKAL
jgi:hypothetical protein